MRLRFPIACLLLVGLGITLSACGPRDLEIDRETWANMSPEEQASVQAEYQEMLDAKEEIKQRDRIRGQTRTLSNRGLGIRPESNNPAKDCCI